MSAHVVGRRYAQALFLTAKQYDVIKSVEGDLDAIVHLLDTDEKFNDFITAPFASRDEKIATLEKVFSDRITALTMQVLRVMLEKRREEDIRSVRNEYVTLRREYEGVVHAVVTTAEMIDQQQKDALIKKLEAVTGKSIESEFHVDAHLIGGVRVAYGNYVLDGSIRGALSNLREKLRHDLLKQQ